MCSANKRSSNGNRVNQKEKSNKNFKILTLKEGNSDGV